MTVSPLWTAPTIPHFGKPEGAATGHPRVITPGFSADYDAVSHPAHYTAYKGIEVIQLTEQLNFNKGNCVKYVARAGLKDPAKEIEDLRKAAWYLDREIQRLSTEKA